jgi:hypothetical protein
MTKMLTITRSVLCEKFKVNGAIARALIKDGIKKGTIKEIGDHSARFDLCSGVGAKSALDKAAEEAAAALAKKEKK